jgi:hypothetical protein
MAVNIPDAPTNGQVLTVGARSWAYNSTTTTWEIVPATGGAGLDEVLLFAGM